MHKAAVWRSRSGHSPKKRPMILLTLPLVLLLPQAVAAQRRAGPAIHLTLLLLGLCAATVVQASYALSTSPRAVVEYSETYITESLSPLTYAVMALALLTPAYWGIEQFCPLRDTRIDVVLVQTLALSFAAVLSGGTQSLPHVLTEWTALALSLALGVRAVQSMTQTNNEN